MEDVITYQPIVSEDYSELTNIMTRAFNEDTALHTDAEEGGPNGYNDGSLLRLLNRKKAYNSFKICYEGHTVGAYTISIPEEGVYCLEMLFIDPKLRGKHLGARVWRDIEARHSCAKSWVTETPSYSKRNHKFYTNKCGFKLIEERTHDNGAKSLYFRKEV